MASSKPTTKRQGTPTSSWANRIVAHGEEAPEQLVANPANWRLHSAAQRGALADVLGKVGLVQNVIVNRRSGHLIDGHLRVELAKAQGQPTIPVLYVELSAAEEAIVLASLDPIGAMAIADKERLSELLCGIETPDLAGLLEAVARANRLPLDFASPGLTDPDEVPEVPEEPLSAPGDLWLLGDHRLLCGDATNVEDVERLMNGERATLMATDPPYLVDYRGGEHPASAANRGSPSKDKHWDAYIDHEHSVEFYVAFLQTALECALSKDAALYQCFGIMRTEVIWAAWRAVGLLPHQVLIWKKTRAVLTYSHFLWDYEPLMYGWRAGHQPASKPPANATAVWEIASVIEDGASGLHPTQKPVQLYRRPILYHSAPGDLAYEPFCGSGTALIAAEQTGRRCYAIEQAPAFVDVAVARWQRFTGAEATLEGDGRCFEQLAAQRRQGQ
jgi:DNA modification methylase